MRKAIFLRYYANKNILTFRYLSVIYAVGTLFLTKFRHFMVFSIYTYSSSSPFLPLLANTFLHTQRQPK